MSETAATDCRNCGHPAKHHDEGGASCWTTADGEETWGESACRCDWYDPSRPPEHQLNR